ncbi:hypothetical protein H8959_019976 [Pygathrix nigripes]
MPAGLSSHCGNEKLPPQISKCLPRGELNDPSDKPPCRGCSSYLMEPYIKCAECGPPPFFLCLQCFTRGFEYKKHQSDHTYEIMSQEGYEFSIDIDSKISLLDLILPHVLGIFTYLTHYYELSQCQVQEVVCYFCSLGCVSDATDDPPRPTFDSLLSRDMAGYMPARADFIELLTLAIRSHDLPFTKLFVDNNIPVG